MLSRFPHTDTIRQACWQETALDIGYVGKDGASSRRMVYPLAMIYTDRTFTLLAWCCLRAHFRMFRTERISRVEPMETSFRPRRAALLRRYLEQLGQREIEEF